MKKLILLFLSLPILNYAQQPCKGDYDDVIFQANKIGASFLPQGEKFFDLNHAYFKVPYTDEKSASTIFASSPWIGGYIQGELKFAGQTYLGSNKSEFNVGPLGLHAELLVDICDYFNRVWTVSRSNVMNHIEDFMMDGIIDDTVDAVFGWPAQGNQFFSQFNGFELPLTHIGGWAEFADLNKNALYDPDQGEYPIIKLRGNEFIPEQIMWMVFNDKGTHNLTKSDPLGVEIQLTVYGFNCTENTTLNYTLFNSYKMINQNDHPIDSLYFGLWTDYDLGCSTDDYMGSDSARSTEFVYNQDSLDGSVGIECPSSVPTYGAFPPVQSHTYLSQPMHSFIMAAPFYLFDTINAINTTLQFYRILKGQWFDGNPITAFGTGYNPGEILPVTNFLFHGDPRDPGQWAQSNLVENVGDPRSVSSVYLNTLESYDSIIIETAYQFHQDSSLNNLEQIGFMHENVDYLLNNLENITFECSQFPICNENDCVWPGDFNHNGIADHFDLLYWGVMKDTLGSKRDGRIAWDGYFSDNWNLDLPDGLNAKHGDGNGNGIVNVEDLERNIHHFLLTNYLYTPQKVYPVGPEIILSSDPIDINGNIRDLRIKTGTDIENVLGMAYEIEFDTSFFVFNRMINFWPSDSNFLMYSSREYVDDNTILTEDNKFSCVQTDHEGINIPEGFGLQRSFVYGLYLKQGLSHEDIPDSTIIRLRNLIAIDPQGNDLHIGSIPLVVYKNEITSNADLVGEEISFYPNPASDLLFFETLYELSGELMNVHGQKLKSFITKDSMPVDISGYPAGIYFLRFSGHSRTYKLVVY